MATQRNYAQQMDAVLATLGDTRPRLLLHACCGPCSSAVLEQLCRYFEITVLYYNPNTWPAAEYYRRGEELQKFVAAAHPLGVTVVEDTYDPQQFYTAVAGLENEPERGSRCTVCYRLRMRRAAQYAAEHGFDWFTTTLSISPHKDAKRINAIGQELEQELDNLTAENEDLTAQIAESRADIQILKDDKKQAIREKQEAEQRAEDAEKELKSLEDRRNVLQPIMDNASKEIKEYGMIKTFLPEATTLERAVTYRDKKIKPLFIEMKNKIGAMAAQVKELTRERDSWKSKFQKKKQEHEKTKEELAEVQKDYQKLSGEKEILQGIADRYNRLLRMLGKDMVERLVQDDIRMQTELEAKKQKEQMPKKIGDRIQWARERSEEHNAKIKKNKAKYRGMEL